MKTNARWVNYDTQSLQAIGDALGVLPVPAGAIERTASGIDVKADSITEAMLASAFKALVGYLAQDEMVSGNWTFSNAVTAATAPTTANHLANKAYVDSVATGLDVKASVRAATTASITLSGEQTIDGVVLVAGDRVLVKNQGTASQNGWYVVAVGAWSRATDADASAEVTSGAFTFVEQGTVNGTTGWVLSTANPIVLGTTALTFTQFSGASSITAGNGLLFTGSVLDIVPANDSIVVAADSIRVGVDGTTIEVATSIGLRVKANSIGASHITTGVAGNGLTGGNGAALSVVAAAFIRGGAVELDADLLTISYVPTNYTRTTGAIATHVEHLTAHLAGIDAAIAALPEPRTQLFTLGAPDIAAKYVTLASAPHTANRVRMSIRGAPAQFYGADFAMDGTNTDRLTWNALGLDGQLASGDQVTVEYEI